ncbi:MAG: PEGA domain-containing protein [Myxococcales bacterium]|nr:PEGA domain-containing protein [Myxococcales bacterium]
MLGLLLAVVAPAAARHQQAALAHAEAGRLAEAAAAWQRAYAADPHPVFLLNLAAVQSALPRGCGPAIGTFDRLLARCAETPCAEEPLARERRAELAAACLARVDVRSRPPGARAQIDGQAAGTTPLEATLTTDTPHEIVLEIEGFYPGRRVIEPRPRERFELELGLRPIPPPTPPPKEEDGPGRALAWGLLGAGLVGAGVTGGLHAAAGEPSTGEWVGLGLGYGLSAGLLGVGFWLLGAPDGGRVAF